ncbi:GCD complex subunit gcd7 [Tilletia horrida]|uniref:Translation initiation factor eIF2B subunit beta n=1 Tax=Tilletia horrida TaxID=155126 RepID=A0AAN6G6I5_9BASI|nr:GCD complex subunit gcd7 [Tilletia horrida]
MTTTTAAAGAGATKTKVSAEAELQRAIPDRNARNAVLAFALRLRRQQDASLHSARTLATTTALVCHAIVRAHTPSSSSSSSAAGGGAGGGAASIEELVASLDAAGAFLQQAARAEQTIGNTVRRIVTIIREEAVSAVHNTAAGVATSPSLAAGGGAGAGAVGQVRVSLGSLGTPQRGTASILSRMSSTTTSPAALSRRQSSAAAAAHTPTSPPSGASSLLPLTGAGPPVPSSSSSILSSPVNSSAPSLTQSTSSSAPGTGASTPYHHHHHHHHSSHASSSHPVRPGLASMPSAFGSFSISDLVSVGSSQGGTGLPPPSGSTASSKLAMSSIFSSSEGGGGSSAGILTPERSIVLGRATKEPDVGAHEDEEMTEKQDAGDDEKNEDEEAEEDEEDEEEAAAAGGAGDEDAEDELGIKPLLLQAIQEYIDEIDSVPSSIAKDARDHIHSGETILTLGRSRTIEAFLKAAAAKDRHFTVIVPEGAPDYDGHHLARTLAHLLPPSNPVLLIPDSAVQPLMPRISKVLLSAHSILPNGGILTRARGAGLASLAASEMRTPVVVLAGVFKVCPDWSAIGGGGGSVGGAGTGTGTGTGTGVLGAAFGSRRASYDVNMGAVTSAGPLSPAGGGLDAPFHFGATSTGHAQTAVPVIMPGSGLLPLGTSIGAAAHPRATKPYSITPLSPAALLPRSNEDGVLSASAPALWAHAEAYTPEWEYIDPARIDVLITNVGEHPPSYVYRLVKENYHVGE